MKSALPGIPQLAAPVSRFWLQGLLFAVLVGAFLPSAQAWSSSASKTQSYLKQLDLAIRTYQADNGKLPSPGTFRDELEGYAEERVFNDRWKQPFFYKAPGLHGDFDLYSIGPDGIDNAGAGDDISAWAGVNDGYHWKATWPQGRRTVAGAFIAGALCLLLGRFFPWPLVIPVAGMVTCAGLIWGCNLLMHPGITTRRDLLSLAAFVLVIAFAVFLAFLIRALRSASASTADLPNFLTIAQIRDLFSPLSRDLKLQIIRFHSKKESTPRHASEMTVEELEQLISQSMARKHLSGGNLELRLPAMKNSLIGNHDGLYWLEF